MLNDFETQPPKCLLYDEMVENFPSFCLIATIFFAYIKQKLRFQGLKWVMIKQNESWLACLEHVLADVSPTLGRYRPCDVGPTPLRRWVDVARWRRPNIGSTSVTILDYYNQNKQKCSTTKRHDSLLSWKKLNNGNGSLHDACKSQKQM